MEHTSQKALKFLEDILPYLVVKKERALIAIEFQKLQTASIGVRAQGHGFKPISNEVWNTREASLNV